MHMATLKLTSLHCERKQDLIGADEIKILVGKDSVWFDSMRKGETKSLEPVAVEFDGVAAVTVQEVDGSKAKTIGAPVNVRATGDNQVPLVFKTSGAHYELYYELTVSAGPISTDPTTAATPVVTGKRV
jgi:hypothetical protein